MENDLQKSELSLQEYACLHGLTKDHLRPHPLDVLPGTDDVWQLLEDSPDLLHIDGEKGSVLTERFTVEPETASFLASLVPERNEQNSKFDGDDSTKIRRFRDLKIELPLLRTDHSLDILSFQRQAQTDLYNEFLPLETLDEEDDEGLTWPSQPAQLSNETWKKATSEKFAIPCEILQYLQGVLQWHQEGGEYKTFEDADSEPIYQRERSRDRFTPPLLPMSPDTHPYEPSSETGLLDLVSEATSPIQEELRQAETSVFKNDAIQPISKVEPTSSPYLEKLSHDSDSLGDIYSPLRGIKGPVTSPPQRRLLIHDCKVEVPLSPPVSDGLPPWKRKNVSLKNAIEDVIPDLPLLIPASQNNLDEEVDAFFERKIAPVAIKANQLVEREQLQEADTTQRVAVPVMHFYHSDPPWNHHANPANSQAIIDDLFSQLERHDLKRSYWPLSGKIERELTYVAFPSAFAKVEIQEQIVGDGSEADFLRQPECVGPDTLIWKPDGLRIFDELADSDEEDLEEGIFPDGRDLISLTRKRKLELEEEDDDMNEMAASEEAPHKQTVSSVLQPGQKPMDDMDFSALDALEDYIAIRKGDINAVQKVNLDKAQQERTTDQSLSDPNHGCLIPTVQKIETPAPKSSTVPVPSICLPRDSRQFIVSTALLQDRALIRGILRLYPTAEIVERDCTLHSQARKGKSIKDQPFVDCDGVCNEADIIISPGTGLITTTLQKLKQRPLPGQTSHSAIRDRVSQTAPRYERLLVLVKNDLLSWAAAADGQEASSIVQDCEALADFIAFCSALSQDVSVTLVCGGDEQLATWIVALMIRYSDTAGPEITPAQDETPAEIFLRRAGLNAFAAQAIIAAILGTGDRTMQQEGTALSCFVRMPLQEKLARFHGILGGERMLVRVHSILEFHW